MPDFFLQRLTGELAEQRASGLFRELRVHTPGGINLCANDYLQLRRHPLVIAGAGQALAEFGAGSGASPLLSGYLPCHERLLDQLRTWKGKSSGLLFNTGFMANQAVLKHLPGPRDLVLADRLIHHSMLQALTSGKAKFTRYRHLDLPHLEELLEKNRKHFATIFVVTESVFSMDGDYPDLAAIAALKKHLPFVWILDEAHGVGCFGGGGGGLAEEMGVLPGVDIFIGTMGKALASAGGYVLSSHSAIIDYLLNFAGEFIYSTCFPPAQAGAASAAIPLAQNARAERQRLRELGAGLRRLLAARGFKTNDFASQIVPVIIGDSSETMRLRERLRERGFLVGAARPPTVPAGTSRLRISLHTGIGMEQAHALLEAITECHAR